MEDNTFGIGRVYADTAVMGYSSDKGLPGDFGKQAHQTHGNNHTFMYYFFINLLTAGYYGLQIFKNKMALAFKILVINFFGSLCAIFGMAAAFWPGLLNDIQIKDLPEPARWVFMLLGAAYIFYIVMNARENYRKKKIDNDERALQLKQKHERQKR